MNRVVVDEAVRAKLNGQSEQLELWDESGHELGHYLPADKFRALLRACGQSLFTDVEVRQAEEQPRTGKSLGEIWKELGRQ
jgi:hypothetical protein